MRINLGLEIFARKLLTVTIKPFFSFETIAQNVCEMMMLSERVFPSLFRIRITVASLLHLRGRGGRGVVVFSIYSFSNIERTDSNSYR